MQYYSRRVKFIDTDSETDRFPVHPSIFIRIAQLQSSALFPSLRRLEFYFSESFGSHIFLFLSPLLDSLELYDISGFENTVVGPFLATLSNSPQMLRHIALRDGRMPVDILKKTIVSFYQLRSLLLFDAVFMSDFSLLEVLGTLPLLESLTLIANDPESHPAHAPENSNCQNGGLRYFEALESLYIAGSFPLIQHLLGFVDSSCLKSIKVYPLVNNVSDSEREHDPGDFLLPFVTIFATKWSQSLTNLTISPDSPTASGFTHRNSKFLTLLANLCEIREFDLMGWDMENIDDAVRRLAKSWPKLRSLALGTIRQPLNQTFVSLSTLRIIADNCPELHYLHIPLDISTFPPFDDFSTKNGSRHNLEVLRLGGPGGVHPPDQTILECQIQVARHLDLIFPYLKTILRTHDEKCSGIHHLVKLCQDVRRLGQHK